MSAMTPRIITRQQWKVIWRRMRVAAREAHKAHLDALIYGTGAVFVPNDGGDPRHVPIEELRL